MDNKRQINVKIADRTYPLLVDSNNESEEEVIRKAAKKINDTIAHYKQLYTNNDEVDFLAMASLMFAKKLTEVEFNQEARPVIDEMKHCTEIMSELLNDDK